ncbi:predicted protein [Postia placenta Mad-698-R]|uniref:Uncharacterized protein n=1 Tax=Postia placenta MAD-698-R-SB12 TaxID=670580 RepID=A0A1X6N641_9APHY|nr:hypothetical protein POSPLADRAFT_1136721 [Postia placenta MAD-698-R-SB12]EED81886.1 predicted protein [Postia placenta Mad-698-R]OSX64081.1 hypothetical protein POSPLADRAFT_1136721 [Postia placenta MAD-698-R-SB12]
MYSPSSLHSNPQPSGSSNWQINAGIPSNASYGHNAFGVKPQRTQRRYGGNSPDNYWQPIIGGNGTLSHAATAPVPLQPVLSAPKYVKTEVFPQPGPSSYSHGIQGEDTLPSTNSSWTSSPPFKKRKLTPPQPANDSVASSYPPVQVQPLAFTSQSAVPPIPTSTIASTLRSSGTPPVKRERSLSPVLPSSPRVTTEGSIRFAPLPEHCRKAHAQYIANRKVWVNQEVKKLKQINPSIRAVRVLTRDDGMVIDWRSSVPVMSDTLLSANKGQDPPPSRPSATPDALSVGLSVLEVPQSQQLSPNRGTPPLSPPIVAMCEPEGVPASCASPAARYDVTPSSAGNSSNLPMAKSAAKLDNSDNCASSRANSSSSTAGRNAAPTRAPNSAKREEIAHPQPGPSCVTRSTPSSSPCADANVIPQGVTSEQHQQPDPSRRSDQPAPPGTTLPPTQGAMARPGESPVVPQETAPASRKSLSQSLELPRRAPPQMSHPETTPDCSSSRPSPPVPTQFEDLSTPSVHQLVAAISTPTRTSDEEGYQMESAALDFLRRFIVTYDSDRSALASAYSRFATFSVQTIARSGRTLEGPDPRKLKQGRLDIMAGLLCLPDERRFCASGPTKVEYDVVHLGATFGVLLICYSGNESGTWACDQRFVLQYKDWDEEDRTRLPTDIVQAHGIGEALQPGVACISEAALWVELQSQTPLVSPKQPTNSALSGWSEDGRSKYSQVDADEICSLPAISGESSLYSQDQRLEIIEAAALYHRQALSQLHKSLNAMLPVHRLLPEVLTAIFTFVVLDCTVTDGNHQRDIQLFYLWMRVMHVCSYWRTVTLGSPLLWSNILITPNAEFMAQALKLAGTAPLVINAIGCRLREALNTEHIASLRTVLQAMPRIKELHIAANHLATAIAEKISGAALLRLLKLQEADDERKRFSVRIMGFNHAGSSSFLPNHDCFRMSVIPPPYQLHITLNGLRSWERPWRTLSTVRACQQAGSALLEALSKRREGAYNNPDSLFMPQLNHLSLHEVYCRQAPPDSEDYDVTDLLLESLKFRQGKGKRLEKLTLEYCININRRDVRQYREYVEKVVWDKGVHYEDPAESDSDLEDWRSIPDGWE